MVASENSLKNVCRSIFFSLRMKRNVFFDRFLISAINSYVTLIHVETVRLYDESLELNGRLKCV